MNQARKVNFIFGVVAVVLLICFAVAFWRGKMAVDAYAAIPARGDLVQDLERIRSTLAELEAEAYAFVLTGEFEHADAVRQAAREIPTLREELGNHSVAGLLPQDELPPFTALLQLQLEHAERCVELRQQGQVNDAVALITDPARESAHKNSGDTLDRWQEAAAGQLAAQLDRASRYAGTRVIVFLAGLLIGLAFMVWAYRKLQREVQLRMAASDRADHSKELLAVTLASIGDAVIQTDTEANITFINPTAEKLTGWTLDEARGRPCSEVFKILNEHTREPVPSPVEMVLKTGHVAGLDAHTLLVRKDGSEIYIDDSASPIQREGGEFLGVVLIFRDFSAHKRADDELKIARDEQEAANAAKDHFIATLSHELRTPLTPVLGTLKFWERQGELPEHMAADVVMMRRNVEMESRLIDDLLDLTRIQKGKMPLKPEVVNVHQLLSAVEGIFKDEIFLRSADFHANYEAEEHYVSVDPARFQQVLWNVLGNALKFTPQGRKVGVYTTNLTPGELTIIFEDEGIGMSTETASKIFLPFEQGGGETKRARGLGLGLAIANSIVQAHGGRMEARSSGPQRGSTFLVHLPTVVPTKAERMSAEPVQDRVEQADGKRKVLLVEDHHDTAYVISRVLRNSGYEVVVCSEQTLALELCRQHEFTVVVSDIGLKEGSGLDLMREIRKFSTVPSIALTGYGMREDLEKCRAAGFTDHLTKPIDMDQLLTAMEQVITRQTPPPGLPDGLVETT